MAMRKRNSKRFKIFKFFLYLSMFVTSMYIFWKGAKILGTAGIWWQNSKICHRNLKFVINIFRLQYPSPLISYKSTNMRRYLSFNTSFKDIRESPSTNNHDASTPRFPNLMVCNYQSHSRMKIKEKFSNVHWKHLASLYQT